MGRRGINIAGMGVICALGRDATSTLTSLRDARTGLRLPEFTPTTLRVPVGEVPMSDSDLRRGLGAPSRIGSRTALLALTAAREAIADSGLTAEQLKDTTLISSTTVGGMRETPLFFAPFAAYARQGRLRHIAEHTCHSHTDTVADMLGLGGWRTTLSTACSSGANAILMGAMMIEAGMATRVVAGGADALCAFTLGGFNSLKILSREACHPLSAERDGLNLGEGAAYVVLTADETPTSRGRLTGWKNANDAHHQTAMSDDGRGAQDAMRGAMRKAQVETGDIGYVNLHGTATPNNDQSEMAALAGIWGDAPLPLFGSTKGLTGHTLAAAGAMEAVFCLMALGENVAWGTAGLASPMQGFPPPAAKNTPTRGRHAMSNSLGFGGNCTSLIFSKP